MKQLVQQLQQSYPQFSFKTDTAFAWSPAHQEVRYRETGDSTVGQWALFHELSHGLLGHKTYHIDLDLLLMEVAAWEKAVEIARQHGQQIDTDHIQDCLDTYRDWLDQRSTCPSCATNGLQQNSRQYSCFTCGVTWDVSPSRFCRPYRQVHRGKQKTSPESLPQAMFQ